MGKQEYHAAGLSPRILYADNHLLAVDKPAGLLTQDSGTGLRNLEDWAREWVRVDKNKAGSVFLNAVHRIDKAVSGVVLFARTSKALARLNEEIRNRHCQKMYHTWVEGTPEHSTAELVHWLAHEHHRANVCREGMRGAQRAVLSYRILQQRGQSTLLEVDLKTGRYHQIRVQLASIHCPILGDEKYGARRTTNTTGIALHHAQLKITHPTNREPIILTAPYPDEPDWWHGIE